MSIVSGKGTRRQKSLRYDVICPRNARKHQIEALVGLSQSSLRTYGYASLSYVSSISSPFPSVYPLSRTASLSNPSLNGGTFTSSVRSSLCQYQSMFTRMCFMPFIANFMELIGLQSNHGSIAFTASLSLLPVSHLPKLIGQPPAISRL